MLAALREAYWGQPMPRRARRLLACALLVVVGALVLARLGEYGLWDDEADTALYGEAIWRTGDTTAIHGANIIAYRDGVELDHQLNNRLVAPLAYYVEAPFVRDTFDPFWARLPFALAGLATLALALWWLDRANASRATWALVALAASGNVSFLLYSRQARYYPLAMLCTLAMLYAYAHRARGRRMLIAMGAAGVALLATHYLCYAGAAAALGIDYLIWGRREAPISKRALLALIGSQIAIGLPIVLVWYPLGKEIAAQGPDGLSLRAALWLRMLRELNATEIVVGVFLMFGPLLYRRSRDELLYRLPLGILLATAVVTVFSPQPATAMLADVRYVAFLLPACVWLGIRTIQALPVKGAAALAVGVLAFHTTVLHAGFSKVFPTWGYQVPLRNSLSTYLGELADPPASAYRAASTWLNEHGTTGESVLVLPDFGTVPMVFASPRFVYAWQLSPARAAQFPALSPINTYGRVAPDWIVMFGGFTNPPQLDALERLGARYRLIDKLPVTGVDASRAELFWHNFDAARALDPRAPLTFWHRQ